MVQRERLLKGLNTLRNRQRRQAELAIHEQRLYRRVYAGEVAHAAHTTQAA